MPEASQNATGVSQEFGSPGWSQPIWQRPLILLGFPEWRWPRYCQAILSQVRSEQGVVALDGGTRRSESPRGGR
jgi:hypothetical protein